MEDDVKSSMFEVTRHLASHTGDQAALLAVFEAVRDAGRVDELVALLELWTQAEQGDGVPDREMAELYFRIAKRSKRAHALASCRTALDLYPAHLGALLLFEELADASWMDELCARYQTFLEDAPSQGVSPHVQQTVTTKLIEAERRAASREAGRDYSAALPVSAAVAP